jgi:hypothetical protein
VKYQRGGNVVITSKFCFKEFHFSFYFHWRAISYLENLEMFCFPSPPHTRHKARKLKTFPFFFLTQIFHHVGSVSFLSLVRLLSFPESLLIPWIVVFSVPVRESHWNPHWISLVVNYSSFRRTSKPLVNLTETLTHRISLLFVNCSSFSDWTKFCVCSVCDWTKFRAGMLSFEASCYVLFLVLFSIHCFFSFDCDMFRVFDYDLDGLCHF